MKPDVIYANSYFLLKKMPQSAALKFNQLHLHLPPKWVADDFGRSPDFKTSNKYSSLPGYPVASFEYISLLQ
jgi:hypothetical protein